MPPEGKKTDLEGRYALLSIRSETPSAGVTNSNNEETGQKNYAAFLREKERVLGPDGFVDSKSVQYKYTKRQESLKKQNDDKEQSYSPDARRKAVGAIDISVRNSEDQKEYDKLLHIIENRSVQKKQEERELKRQLGDIKKLEQSMRKENRDNERDYTTKSINEDKKMVDIQSRTTDIQRQHIFDKEKTTKKRTEAHIYAEMEKKDSGRKLQLVSSELTLKFRTKLAELESRQKEAQRISEEYENKLRAKEEMQHQLKQELNEIALALNMELQKGQTKEETLERKQKREEMQKLKEDEEKETKLNENIRTVESDFKTVNRSLRHLSAELTLTRAHMQMKQREETRHKQDNQIKLKRNFEQQDNLTDAAYKAHLDQKSKESEENVQKHLLRKRLIATQQWHEKKDRKEQSDAENLEKFQQRSADMNQRAHEDDLKHFQKAVEKGEMLERSLYEKAKSSEFARQKQSQVVRQLQRSLSETRQQNSLRLQAELADITKKEQEILLQIQKEKAALDKIHAHREEAYYSLLSQREKLREDRHFLTEHEREHKRLKRIGQRTQSGS